MPSAPLRQHKPETHIVSLQIRCLWLFVPYLPCTVPHFNVGEAAIRLWGANQWQVLKDLVQAIHNGASAGIMSTLCPCQPSSRVIQGSLYFLTFPSTASLHPHFQILVLTFCEPKKSGLLPLQHQPILTEAELIVPLSCNENSSYKFIHLEIYTQPHAIEHSHLGGGRTEVTQYFILRISWKI